MDELEPNQQVELMTHIREVIRGNKPFEHPGAPSYRPGQRYEATAEDLQFDKETRSDMSRNALFRGIIWGGTPAIMFNIPQIRNSWMFRNQKSALPAVLICGTLGYVKGSLENASTYARRRFLLDSPIGKESRFKLYQMNPSHPWLRGFEHEFENNNRRAQMQERRPSRGYGKPGMNPNSQFHERQDDGFSVDEWFSGGNEGGTIPGGRMSQQRQEDTYQPPTEQLSRADAYRQKRREFDRNRGDNTSSYGDEYSSTNSREDYPRRSRNYDQSDSFQKRREAYESRGRYTRDPPPRAAYGQSDDDFISQKDFQTDDDQFVSNTPRSKDEWY